ncbi:MAG: hypothetical protein EXR50_05675 [Dehalococcoidia bacterium]|nr:hypothetical protein [Dehalococcoidia bacterium]
MIGKTKTLKADNWSLAEAFAKQYACGRDRDVGAVEAGIVDIYDSTIELYDKILPNIAKLKSPSSDDLLGEIVDLEMELKHIQDHARDAIKGLRHISKTLCKAEEGSGKKERTTG